MDDKQRIDDALIAFDEMGFEPTTLLPDYERARKAWKANLVAAIEEMDTETEALKRTIKKLQAANVDLKRTNEAIQKTTAKNIADWIAFRAFHGGYAEPFQNVLSELSDLIKRNYGAEVDKNE